MSELVNSDACPRPTADRAVAVAAGVAMEELHTELLKQPAWGVGTCHYRPIYTTRARRTAQTAGSGRARVSMLALSPEAVHLIPCLMPWAPCTRSHI